MTTGLFAFLLHRCDRDTIIGDLVEEQTLLEPRDASRFLRNQILRSIPPILWATVRRGQWLKALGATLVGYLVVALLVISADVAMSKILSGGDAVYSLASLAVGFPAMTLGGYLAEWIRPRAAIALAIISAVMGVVSLAATGEGAPLWYQISLIVIAPVAAVTGGRIRSRQKEGSRA